jgi:tRNA(Arg) A34 adenosine deaminase TadA
MTQDQKLISRCIELAQKALRLGDAPFGSLIADRNGKVLVEAHNAVRLKGDVTAHAEILAMRKLQKKLGK